ncbi:hypothetical protein BJ742DRAFT_787648 [Cladochytrium replicatum]|nr:hypothetical protein BJ742DRAFT_787648 [Cladochytrium replicatum]
MPLDTEHKKTGVPTERRRRRREVFPVKACDQCYKRKLKCDALLPSCSRCASVQTDCTYLRKSNPSLVRRQKTDRTMEGKLNDIGHMLVPMLSRTDQGSSLTLPTPTLNFAEERSHLPKEMDDETELYDDDEEDIRDQTDPAGGVSQRLDVLIGALERLATGVSTSPSIGPAFFSAGKLKESSGVRIVVSNLKDVGGVDILPMHVVRELVTVALDNTFWPYDVVSSHYVLDKFEKVPRITLAAIAARSAHSFKDLSIPGPNGVTLVISSRQIGEGFFEKATSLIDFENPSIAGVVALMNMGMYCSSSTLFRSSYMYKGLARTMAKLLCFDIDPDEFEKKSGVTMPSIQKEIRRRIWWALVMTDLPDECSEFRNCKVARPLPIRLTKILTDDIFELPKDVLALYPPDATSYAMDLALSFGKIMAFGRLIKAPKAIGIALPADTFHDLMREQLNSFETMPNWIKQSLSAPVLSPDIGSIDPPSYFAVVDHIIFYGNIILLNRHQLNFTSVDDNPIGLLRNECFSGCYLAASAIVMILKNVLMTKDNLGEFRAIGCITFMLAQSLFVHILAMVVSKQVNDSTMYQNSKLGVQSIFEFVKGQDARFGSVKQLVDSSLLIINDLERQNNQIPSAQTETGQILDNADRERAIDLLKLVNNVTFCGREGAISESVVSSICTSSDQNSAATNDITSWFKNHFLTPTTSFITGQMGPQSTPDAPPPKFGAADPLPDNFGGSIGTSSATSLTDLGLGVHGRLSNVIRVFEGNGLGDSFTFDNLVAPRAKTPEDSLSFLDAFSWRKMDWRIPETAESMRLFV